MSSTGSRRVQQDSSSRDARAPEKQAGTVPDAFTLEPERCAEGWRVTYKRTPSASYSVVEESLSAALASACTHLAAMSRAAPAPVVERREWSTHEAPTYESVDSLRNAGAL